jgi:poly(A) polymerase
VRLALADTDRRVSEGKPVAPSFLLACLLWHDVLNHWKQMQAKGEPPFPALQAATEAVFDARIGDISGRGKLAADMREIWTMQPRFERRSGNGPTALVDQPRFRAGFDFLRLRAQAGEADADLATWWEDFSLADMPERRELMDVARQQDQARRQPRGASGPTGASGAVSAAGGGAETVSGDAPPARKRRRRRRKPAGEGGAGAGTGASAGAEGDSD